MRLVVLAGLALASLLAGCGAQTTAPTEGPSAASDRGPTAEPSERSERSERSDPPTPSEPSGPAPVEAFLRFATGEAPGTDVPWGDEVVLSIERTAIARLDAASAGTRTVWSGCVRRTATVEARSCPVDVLGAIADRDRRASPVVIEDEPPRLGLGCARYEPPRARDDETVLWLRPPQERRDCVSDMAVAVTASPGGEVVAVDLALSSP